MALPPIRYTNHAQLSRKRGEISAAEVLATLNYPDKTVTGDGFRQAHKLLGRRYLRVTYVELPERILILTITPKLAPW